MDWRLATLSSHGTHKLTTKNSAAHKKMCYFFADLTKNRYSFDSFTLKGYCCVGCCHFFNLTV